MKKILLIEDDENLGATLAERLTQSGYNVTLCKSVSDFKNRIEANSFDLFLVDIGLPDGDGLTLAKEISSTPFIFLTAMSDAEYRLKGFEIGAADFVPKPFHFKELLLRIERVLGSFSKPQTLSSGIKIDRGQMAVHLPNGKQLSLTSRDFKVLELLTSRAPEIVSREEIASKIWSGEYLPATLRSIDNSVLRIRQLLTQSGGIPEECIRSVRGVGYQWCLKEIT